MKRQAEKQLGRDDDDDELQENPSQGFKKADESVLATRVIRGLPKRAGAVPSATARVPEDLTPKTTTPSVFSSNPLGGTGPFKFDASSTASAKSTSTTPFSGFNFKPTTDSSSKSSTPTVNSIFSMSSTSPFAPTQPQPVSSTSNPFSSGISQASNTSKTFASLLNSTGSSTGPTPTAFKPPAPAPSSPATTTNGSAESSLEKYYTNLRALNVSLLSSISKGVESDPFIDVSSFLEKYLSLRSNIQKEFDESSTTSKPKPTEPSASKLAPPVPPTSFAGFGASQKLTSTSTSTSAASETKPKAFDFKATASSPASNPFTATKDLPPGNSAFGTSVFSTAASSTTTSSSPAFTFGSSSSKLGSGTSPFGTFGATAPSSFNIGGSSTPSVFGSSSNSSFVFGASTDKPAPSTSVFGGADKTPSAFQTAPKDAPKSVFGSSTFGSKVAAESWGSVEEKSTEGGDSESGTPATEGPDPATANLLASGPNPHDEEGEGEENEETSHSIKAKAYRLTKAEEEGGSKWVVLGAGILKLKKDKDTGARRVLLRNSTNGKVIMNFNVYSGLKPTQTKAAISFVGHEAGVSQTYSVRLANEDDAIQLRGALEREIEFVKAKEES